MTGTNQAWVAGCRLGVHLYSIAPGLPLLAMVLDAYSRKVVGWALSQEIDARLVIVALQRALVSRQPGAGLIHHSDQGVQYACREYVALLETANARVSMSGKGRPRDNARAESFMRTLKHEEVYLKDYQSFAEAERSVARFIDDVYNEKRFHSSLGYRPPTEFEALLAACSL